MVGEAFAGNFEGRRVAFLCRLKCRNYKNNSARLQPKHVALVVRTRSLSETTHSVTTKCSDSVLGFD